MFRIFRPFILLCLTFSVQAQTAVDSLRRAVSAMPDDTAKVSALNRLCAQLQRTSPDHALDAGREALALARHLGFRLGMAGAFQAMGSCYTERAKFDSAGLVLNLSEEAARLARDTVMMAQAQYLLGRLCIQKEDYTAGIGRLLEALKLQEACCGEAKTPTILRDLGLGYLKMSNFSAAKEVLERAVKLGRTHRASLDEQVPNITYLADLYVRTGRPAEALSMVEQLQAEATKQKADHLSARILIFKGRALYSLERYAAAAQAYEAAMSYPVMKNNPNNLLVLQNKLGNALLMSGRPGQAYPYLKTARSSALRLHNRLSLCDNHIFMMNYFILLHKPDSAFYYFDQYVALKDSLHTEQQDEKVAVLRVQYETEKKDREIAQNYVKMADLQRKNLLAWGLVAGAALLLGGGYASFRQRRRRLEAESRAKTAEAQRLGIELDSRNRELTTFALQLAKRNELLQTIRSEMADIGEKTRSLDTRIRQNLDDEQDWEQFRQYFEKVHPDFWGNAQKTCPQLTTNDLRLLCLVRLKLSNKEIASILHFEPASVISARYRIRKKMGLPEGADFEKLIDSF
jgi:tetratricopeptide (TPR) repeat protein